MTSVFLAIAVGALAFRKRRRHGYGPFFLELVASALVLAGKFYYSSSLVMYLGLSLLVGATVWNTFSAGRRMRERCAAGPPNNPDSQKGIHVMNKERNIEIFSAGCPACEDTIALVNSLACPSCEVTVMDTRRPEVAAMAKRYGIQSVPAVVIDGKLASCCEGRGPEASALKASGIGAPL